MPKPPIQLKRSGTASATPSSLEHGELALNYADSKVFWKNASNTISSFTFQSYALASHTHAASDITSGTLDAARLPLATTIAAGAVIVGTGLGVSSGTVSVTYGTNSTSACRGDDSRLSDTRTPTDNTVSTAKLQDDAVTYAKLQNVSATDRLLGRSSAGSGDVEEITCTAFGRSLIDDADAAAARTTLSVQPTASPAFTGNATITASSGIPLTLNGNSTALRIEEGSGETIDIYRQVSDGLLYLDANQQTFSGFVFRTTPTGGSVTERLRIKSTGESEFTGSVVVNNSGNVVPLTVTNTGTANSFVVNDASGDTSPFVIDASGNVGVGTSSPAAALDVGSGNLRFSSTAQRITGDFSNSTISNRLMFQTSTSNGNTSVRCIPNGTATVSNFVAHNGSDSNNTSFIALQASLTETIVNSGATGTGTYLPLTFYTNNAPQVQISTSGQLLVTAGSGSSGSYKPGVAVSGDDDTGLQQVGGAGTISLVTQGSERVRVDASGNVLVGTTNTDPSFNNVSGVAIGTNYISMSRDNVCFGINRSGTDGDIAVIRQDGVTEGSISVSGNTVSYNAFCGSHWAQLIDNSRPSILRGTVLETIDEMCEWPGEPQNDRLPRVKVSDTPRSRRVYGVFMAWDEDDTATGDMYCTALGAYMVRVSGAVQSGDLLESAGDGTARTQPDDIVRSSTIGKVSSTHRVAEYDDGSYLVPCVLMCG